MRQRVIPGVAIVLFVFMCVFISDANAEDKQGIFRERGGIYLALPSSDMAHGRELGVRYQALVRMNPSSGPVVDAMEAGLTKLLGPSAYMRTVASDLKAILDSSQAWTILILPENENFIVEIMKMIPPRMAETKAQIRMEGELAEALKKQVERLRLFGDQTSNTVAAKQKDSAQDAQAHSYYDRAVAYDKKEENDLAIAEYTKVIDLKPSARLYCAAIGRRGTLYRIKKDWDRAIADLTKAIEGNPDVATTGTDLSERSLVYFFKSRSPERKKDLENYYDLAMRDINNAIQVNPNEPEYYETRSTMHAAKGNFDQSWSDVHKAQSLGAHFEEAYLDRLRKDSGRQE